LAGYLLTSLHGEYCDSRNKRRAGFNIFLFSQSFLTRMRYLMKHGGFVIFLSMMLCLVGCSIDPMEACMKQGLEKQLPADGADRGAYIKAREQVRVKCEKS
jgi:hypothetical protein